jgi:ABC-type glycerol-3-phosphate transport system substrate-binding protein
MSNSTMLAAAPTPPPPKKSWLSWNLVGLLLLAAAFMVSIVSLLRVRSEIFDPNIKVVRLLHWQLELGFRDALQQVIDDYNRMQEARFAKGEIPQLVKVVQLGVTEKVYGQFLNTHLIANTAPDICALGMASSTWGSTKAQFFTQFGEVIDQPNPYNSRAFDDGEGLDPELREALPNIPWKSTFVEGMQSGWDGELQGYFGVPPLIFTGNRISVNLDMLKAATGSERLPTTLGEFLAAADAIRAYAKSEGKDIIPVAGSRYSQEFWRSLAASFFFMHQDKLDRNLDGEVDELEGWTGIRKGVIALDLSLIHI